MKVLYGPDPETPISIQSETLRADWYNAGEGLCGGYNPNDPEDMNLLRFDIYQRGNKREDWQAVEDASYCTRVPATADMEYLEVTLKTIFLRYEDALRDDPYASVKKLGEELSWL